MDNVEALEHWSGAAGEHWAAEAERYDRMNRHFADRIIAAAQPQPGERFLDVGCGNGALALSIAPRVAPGGNVVGLDLSRQMLGVAARRAASQGIANVDFIHGDAQVHDLAGAACDAVVSRFGVMFFADPAAAFSNLAGGLRSGGRPVFSCWQDMARNEWVMVPVTAALAHVPLPTSVDDAATGAFSLADPDAAAALLEASGFTDVTTTEMAAPMWMGSSIPDAVEFMKTTEFAAYLLADVDAVRAAAAWEAVAEAFSAHVGPEGVELQGAAWLVIATAR